MESKSKLRIAHLSGPNATIQNTPPLVTSNKARQRFNLPLLTNPDGGPSKFDALRAQRLAAPVKVYVEQFSAHPLERDAQLKRALGFSEETFTRAARMLRLPERVKEPASP